MKNFIGAFLGFVVGSLALWASGLEIPQYPSPYGIIGILLAAATALLNTFSIIASGIGILEHITAWLLIGLASGLLSKGKWNNVRTSVWIGIIIGVLHVASKLLLNPSFWNQSDRNLVILLSFVVVLPTSQITLVSSIPVSYLVRRIRADEPPQAPERIETRCQCGAVFKSNPMICSECGMILEQNNNGS